MIQLSIILCIDSNAYQGQANGVGGEAGEAGDATPPTPVEANLCTGKCTAGGPF